MLFKILSFFFILLHRMDYASLTHGEKERDGTERDREKGEREGGRGRERQWGKGEKKSMR